MTLSEAVELRDSLREYYDSVGAGSAKAATLNALLLAEILCILEEKRLPWWKRWTL